MTKVLICDDSGMARKQLARSLPETLHADIAFAEHGRDAMNQLQHTTFDLIFLDLNMPEMDGYDVLAALKQRGAMPNVIVVSGDIQPQALQRIKELGAKEFLRKPASKDILYNALAALGFLRSATDDGPAAGSHTELGKVDYFDCYRELSNVAMGQAGDLLARVLGVFVKLPIPRVNLLESSELHMAIEATRDNTSLSAVCQGFISHGVAGEALVLFDDAHYNKLAELMGYNEPEDRQAELELLMDLSNLMIGAYLKGIAEQLNIEFSQSHPVVLGQHSTLDDLINTNAHRWKRTLAIEITYAFEEHEMQCELLLLFTEASLAAMNEKLAYMLDET